MDANTEISRQFEEMFQAILDVRQATRNHYQAPEVNRICLHCAEALDNYLTNAPPPNYGSNLKLGIRSRAGSPQVPADEVRKYIEEVRQRVREYVPSLDLACDNDAWGDARRNRGLPPLKRLLYVMRHTQHHLGQVSQLVRDGYDIGRLCRP